MVTNQQLYLAIGIPLLFNASLIGVLIAMLNSKFDSKVEALDARIDSRFARMDSRFSAIEAQFASIESRFDAVDARFDAVDTRFDAVNARFDGVDRRFDDMRELWRAELRRVEEVLDARLKHIESR